MNIPLLVAHRGDMTHYPENSLPALEAALRAGACMVEFDVQIDADGDAVLLHDADLRRTAGVDASLFELGTTQLRGFSVHEPARFGDRFRPLPPPLLTEALTLLEQFPDAGALVEIKAESLQHWGLDRVMDYLAGALHDHRERCTLISFEPLALAWLQRQGGWRTGWVLPRYDSRHEGQARALQPDLLICNHGKLPAAATPWAGDWRWMLYDITEPQLALDWAARGVEFIETRDIGAMLTDPLLGQRACRRGL